MNKYPANLQDLTAEQFYQIQWFAGKTVRHFCTAKTDEFNYTKYTYDRKIAHISVIRAAFPGFGLRASKFIAEVAFQYFEITGSSIPMPD